MLLLYGCDVFYCGVDGQQEVMNQILISSNQKTLNKIDKFIKQQPSQIGMFMRQINQYFNFNNDKKELGLNYLVGNVFKVFMRNSLYQQLHFLLNNQSAIGDIIFKQNKQDNTKINFADKFIGIIQLIKNNGFIKNKQTAMINRLFVGGIYDNNLTGMVRSQLKHLQIQKHLCNVFLKNTKIAHEQVLPYIFEILTYGQITNTKTVEYKEKLISYIFSCRDMKIIQTFLDALGRNEQFLSTNKEDIRNIIEKNKNKLDALPYNFKWFIIDNIYSNNITAASEEEKKNIKEFNENVNLKLLIELLREEKIQTIENVLEEIKNMIDNIGGWYRAYELDQNDSELLISLKNVGTRIIDSIIIDENPIIHDINKNSLITMVYLLNNFDLSGRECVWSHSYQTNKNVVFDIFYKFYNANVPQNNQNKKQKIINMLLHMFHSANNSSSRDGDLTRILYACGGNIKMEVFTNKDFKHIVRFVFYSQTMYRYGNSASCGQIHGAEDNHWSRFSTYITKNCLISYKLLKQIDSFTSNMNNDDRTKIIESICKNEYMILTLLWDSSLLPELFEMKKYKDNIKVQNDQESYNIAEKILATIETSAVLINCIDLFYADKPSLFGYLLLRYREHEKCISICGKLRKAYTALAEYIVSTPNTYNSVLGVHLETCLRIIGKCESERLKSIILDPKHYYSGLFTRFNNIYENIYGQKNEQ